RLRRGFYFLLILLPGLIIGYYSYVFLRNILTQNINQQRASVATLSAAVIQEKLNNIVNLGESYATRPALRELVAAGNWNEAKNVLDELQKYTPVIDRVILTDAKGILKADTPPLELEAGKSFATSDWFTGLERNGNQPYISK